MLRRVADRLGSSIGYLKESRRISSCSVEKKYSLCYLSTCYPKSFLPVGFRQSRNDTKRWATSGSKCHHCESAVLKCAHCGSLVAPRPDTTYFEIMGQKISYDVSESELKKIYRQLQSEFHPDKFSQKNENDRQISEEISSFVNKAYFTLTNPYERGMYLLKLNNHPFNEGDIQLASDFLMRIVESNEELEEISSAEELEQFDKSNEKEIRELSEKVSAAFLAGDFSAAKSDLNKMKYFLSIKNRIRELQRNM